MKAEQKAQLFQNEIDACTDLIEQTWNTPVFTNQQNQPVELKTVVAGIFAHAQESAKNLIESFAGQDAYYAARNDRKKHLATLTPSGLHYFDGICDALEHFYDSLDDLHRKSYIGLEDRLKPIIMAVKQEFIGFEQCLPRDYGKYLSLYEADEDVAFEFSMEKMKRDVERFTGMNMDQLRSEPFSERNSLYNITQMKVRSGFGADYIFITNIFVHAMLVQRHCNLKEIEAEFQQVETKAPFINELVTLETPWAKLASANSKRAQRKPDRLEDYIESMHAIQTTPVATVEPPKVSEEDRKAKAQALIKSIYGDQQP